LRREREGRAIPPNGEFAARSCTTLSVDVTIGFSAVGVLVLERLPLLDASRDPHGQEFPYSGTRPPPRRVAALAARRGCWRATARRARSSRRRSPFRRDRRRRSAR